MYHVLYGLPDLRVQILNIWKMRNLSIWLVDLFSTWPMKSAYSTINGFDWVLISCVVYIIQIFRICTLRSGDLYNCISHSWKRNKPKRWIKTIFELKKYIIQNIYTVILHFFSSIYAINSWKIFWKINPKTSMSEKIQNSIGGFKHIQFYIFSNEPNYFVNTCYWTSIKFTAFSIAFMQIFKLQCSFRIFFIYKSSQFYFKFLLTRWLIEP